ncbi:MAG: FHA domain-containing protein [Clostridia bacterium]|nr:FHA domain-containing protein [Clostridia bacterium]
MNENLTDILRYSLPILAIIILALCVMALLRRRSPSLGNVQLVNTVNADNYMITSRETSIGSFKDCDIILNYPTISRHHAVISCGRDAWYIKPITKDDIVFVNGNKIEKQTIITAGYKITLGKIDLLFVR